MYVLCMYSIILFNIIHHYVIFLRYSRLLRISTLAAVWEEGRTAKTFSRLVLSQESDSISGLGYVFNNSALSF